MADATTPMPTDWQGLEVLDTATCMRLLDLSPVGRIAFVHAGEPVILPVNHVRVGMGVAFRTASGSTLDAAQRRAPMAFEVDGYDEGTRTGFSVLVRGTSDLELSDEEVARLEEIDVHPWADSHPRSNWIRIHPSDISGRRIPDRHAPDMSST
jgi:nitroimidazol reductase NimA-like FMN-containing flavoprotein (pyridoxamine 5'-phosphate oxidase superfamily)